MNTRVSSLLPVLLVGLLATLLSGCAYISRASESATGVQGDSSSAFASLSADGRWVAFQSVASNIVPGDTNGKWDVFVRDNQTKKVVRVSVRDNGAQGDGHSEFPSISDDGRRIVFASEATNFRADDTNGEQDVFIHDRDTDNDGIFDEPGAVSTVLASVTANGGVAPFGSSTLPDINGDGKGAVFATTSPLAPEDTNGKIDVYSVVLFGGVIPVTTLISKPVGTNDPGNGFSDSATVNYDGSVIAFTTTATNLVAGDTNARSDVVIWDAHTNPPTLTRATGAVLPNDDSKDPDLSDDAFGRYVAFVSTATNLVVPKTASWREVYVADRFGGALTAESRNSFDGTTNGDSDNPTISADGARVTFESTATNLAADTNGQTDVFVRDRPSALTQIASTAEFLDEGNNESHLPAISADGRYVAFHSGATNLVTPDANGVSFDVFTHAAIVPQILGVKRADDIPFLGHFESAPRLHWGPNTVHVTGQGFSPDASVDLGAGIAISSVHVSPTDITFQATVPNGSTGTRNVTVDDPPSAGVGGIGSSQVCLGCVGLQRWATAPDPVASPTGIIVVLSNNEFTSATVAPGFDTLVSVSNQIWLANGSLVSGDNDLTLEQTVNGTVTCVACVHVQ